MEFETKIEDPQLKTGLEISFHFASELLEKQNINLDQPTTARDLLNLLRAKTCDGHMPCYFEDNGVRYYVNIKIENVIQ